MQAAGDVPIEIQEALTAPAPAEATKVVARRRSWRLAPMVGLAGLVVAAVCGFAGWHLKPALAPPAKPVLRLTITLPPGDRLAALDFPAIAISPDGTQVAYVAIRSGSRLIFLRALDSLGAKPLSGTEGANTPFFSADGQSLGFFSGGRLKKIWFCAGIWKRPRFWRDSAFYEIGHQWS